MLRTRASRRIAAAAVGASLAAGGVAFAAGMTVSSEKLYATTLAGGVPHETCALAPAADAYVDEAAPGTPFGSRAALEVVSGASDKRTLVRFDVGSCSIPAGARVKNAALDLRMSAAPAASRTYEAHRVTAAWDETVTWSTQPAVAAAATATASTGATAGSIVRWTATADVQSFLGGTATNRGWRIRDGDETAVVATGSVFGAREQGTALERPRLTIEYYR